MKNENSRYFIGLDIGTDSVGYAVTDSNYALKKFKGEPMWGVHLFEEAALNDQRRAFRTARRRLERRKQRIRLLQNLFANEISKKDENFFIRIKESTLYPEDTTAGTSLFNSENFKDSNYSLKYPTIHHLIMDLIEDSSPHDVRLVYLATAWLISHRGHFLNEISKNNVSDIIDIKNVYEDFLGCFTQDKPWVCDDISGFGRILKKKIGTNKKYKELSTFLYGVPKAPASIHSFGYSPEAILKLLCGGKIAPKQLFLSEEYSDLESFSLDNDDSELAPLFASLGDDAEIILKLKALFDWAVLTDVLQGETYISKSKVKTYEKHKSDLKKLKYLIRKYTPKRYNELFRNQSSGKINYEAYAKGSCNKQEDFCKYVKSFFKDIIPEKKDKELFEYIMESLENISLCPKQVNSDNRVIPYQVYWLELKKILDNASQYLPFLNNTEDGVSTSEKILSIFEFRVPYFVGPLNSSSKNAWLVKKAKGPIYPWNFENMVDLEASEQAFINRMTNTCTYIPDADVLPKMSLCYEKFQFLNEINPIVVNGKRISVETKQRIFKELGLNRKKITKKSIKEFLKSNNLFTAIELETLGGIDDTVKSSLSSHIYFKNLISSAELKEKDVEKIIERKTYTENKKRFSVWLESEYPQLSEENKRYICSANIKDFGRLSREMLCELLGTESNSTTGEACSILDRMWNENVTLMEILSDKYTYFEQLSSIREEYFSANSKTIDERLTEMYVSSAAKRPILRAIDIVSDIVKANGTAPEKIFIEMARGGAKENKGKRTVSRYNQILELYKKCNFEDTRRMSEKLESQGDSLERHLQSDKLFLYYMQLGKCAYTGEQIDIEHLSEKTYDIDHIYPQSKVKDDSVINNKVLVLSTANAEKGDVYPIKPEVRSRMHNWWKFLKDNDFISEEKYKRLTRSIPFSDDERWGFINRQLVETRQSTKALATVLSEIYPRTKIVYVKAGIVSEFRQEFDILKSRAVNDLHHAKDAYLNIVVGNVYNERFTKQWFLDNKDTYNLKIKTLFAHSVKGKNGELVWQGSEDVGRIKRVVQNKNAVHLTRFSVCQKGKFFDLMPVSARKGLVPLKKGLSPEKYGGYNKPSASFFMLVKYSDGKKEELMFVPIELLFADKVISDAEYAEEYVKKAIFDVNGKNASSVSFPIGMRKIKIGTVLEFDGSYRAYITGKSSGGKVIGVSSFTPLILGYSMEKYIKRLEKFAEKKKNNPNMVYSEVYDEVNFENNIELYDALISKLQSPIYSKRPANPSKVLVSGKDSFLKLDIFEQTKVLLQIIMIFSRISGCDLSLVGGVANAAVPTLSSSLSNWKKNYKDVRIIDLSASGLYESRTDNLLELL